MNENIRKSLQDYIEFFGVELGKSKLKEYKDNMCMYDESPYIFWDDKHFEKLVRSYLGDSFNSIYKDEGFVDDYEKFFIKKRKGGRRRIVIPMTKLMDLQKFINKNILKYAEVSELCHAYVKGRSIITNAREHCNKKVVICIDIEEFFKNVDLKKVVDVFLKLGYSSTISTQLSTICMYEGGLAVGAPTSPAISNIVFKEIDNRINEIAKKYGFSYTRYSDDMTFSSNNPQLGYKKFIGLISNIIKEEGFNINNLKTKIYTRKGKQQVTGLIVNNGVKVKSKIKKEVMRHIYYCEKFGIENHINKYSNINDQITTSWFISYLQGKINFIKLVEPYEGGRIQKEFSRVLNKYKIGGEGKDGV